MITLNVNLGAPYEAIIQRFIGRGYAGNQTEVLRQALIAYERDVEEEEALLVHKGVELAMSEVRAGRMKTHSFEKVMKEAGFK